MVQLSEVQAKWAPQYDYLWNPLVKLTNKYTSNWWFFVLLPKQKNGYGPKQLMYTFATQRAKVMRLNGRWCKGMEAPKDQPVNKMNGIATGWYFDGREMHEDLSFLPGELVLDTPGRSLQIQGPHVDKENVIHSNSNYYARMFQDDHQKIQLEFSGLNGKGEFQFWMDHLSDMTKPFVLHRQVKFGGVHMAAMKYMHFKGIIETSSGNEFLEGIGYFQKVMMNIPMFPWLWHWSATEDGSILSYFTAYAGFQAFRRSPHIWPHTLESHTRNILSSAYYYDSQTHQEYNFNKVEIVPEVRGTKFPYFKCKATNPGTVDFMEFRCYPYQHTNFITERPLVNGVTNKFTYNEYLVRIKDLQLRIADIEIDPKKFGNIYGNCEYTWGLLV
ncbi:MAG: hypothetical protein GF308_22055 [Candidatus Heimdallarchaeota archaeon]|nr:hypothetical protein [Candidatus Heimdallarchaeota archaeon]